MHDDRGAEVGRAVEEVYSCVTGHVLGIVKAEEVHFRVVPQGFGLGEQRIGIAAEALQVSPISSADFVVCCQLTHDLLKFRDIDLLRTVKSAFDGFHSRSLLFHVMGKCICQLLDVPIIHEFFSENHEAGPQKLISSSMVYALRRIFLKDKCFLPEGVVTVMPSVS